MSCIFTYANFMYFYQSKSVRSYNFFFILVTCHPDALYLCEQGVNTGVFFEAKRILKKKTRGALF